MKSGASSEKTGIEWEEVYLEHVTRIYNFFRYRVGNDQDAEDLTATTFAQAWNKRNAFNPDRGKVVAWLFGIARRLIARHYRRKNPLQVPFGHLEPEDRLSVIGMDDVRSIEDIADQNAQLIKLFALLSNLPDRDQELFAMKYGADLTNREIARITGLSKTNVGTILHRATERLRAEWGEA